MEQDTAESDICRPEACLLYVALGEVVSKSDSRTDLSLEFLMGRALDNAMLNVGMKDVAKGMLGEGLL